MEPSRREDVRHVTSRESLPEGGQAVALEEGADREHGGYALRSPPLTASLRASRNERFAGALCDAAADVKPLGCHPRVSKHVRIDQIEPEQTTHLLGLL